MKLKSKIILTCAVMGLGVLSHAQTGLGTINPDNSAQLDIKADNRGLLMPRVELTKTTSPKPIQGTPAKSLLVYNTAKIEDVTPGFYYWDDLKWVKLTTGADSGVGQVLGLTLITTDYAVLDTDYTIIASELARDITVSLPDATVNKGRVLVINQSNVANASGSEVTVKFNVPVVYSDAVRTNEMTVPFYYASSSLRITLQSDGINWRVIAFL